MNPGDHKRLLDLERRLKEAEDEIKGLRNEWSGCRIRSTNLVIRIGLTIELWVA